MRGERSFVRSCEVAIEPGESVLNPVCGIYDDGRLCDVCSRLADPERTIKYVRRELSELDEQAGYKKLR